MDKAVAEIKKMWGIFAVGEPSILELRALKPKGHTPPLQPITKHFRVKDHAGPEACKCAFEAEALKLNALGYNVYIVMNPIVESFTGKAVTDEDIAYRDLLLIDIDRVGDTSEPATDTEVEAAKLVADRIATFTAARGWSDALRVMSGNGHHLYYVLKDIPNNQEATKVIQQTLRNLAQTFDNEIVKVDTTVFNASRITKVPGTIMRKGTESSDRPYRMAVVL